MDKYLKEKFKYESYEVVIVEKTTITKPYGWIFFYETRDYLETENFSDMLLGNAPILVKLDGSMQVFGTVYPISQYIEEYEKRIEDQQNDTLHVCFPRTRASFCAISVWVKSFLRYILPYKKE